MVGNKQLKNFHPSSIRNSRAKKNDIQKSALDTSLLSPTSKSMGKHTRSQPSPPPPLSSSPTIPLPPNLYSARFSQPPPSPSQSPSHLDAQCEEDNTFTNNEDPPKLKRKKRGVTQLKGLGIQDSSNATIEVVFNEKGQPIGDSSITLASFIGALVRNKVSIVFDDWRRVSSTHKDNLWTLILLRYKLDETHKDYVFQKMASSLREYRCHVGNAVVEALKLKEEEKIEALAKLKPENLTDNQWSEFIKKRTSVKFQAKSVLMKQVREKHTHPHTMSRLGYARLEQKLKQEKPDQEVTRAMIWTKGHVNKNGNPTNKAVEESIKKIQQFNESQLKTAKQPLKDDALSHVLGEDRPGRVKGLGFGVTSSKLKAQAHTSKMVLSLEEKIRAIEARLNGSGQQGVNEQLSEVDTRRVNENHASSMGLPNPLVGAKCKLMSWYKEGEVVAEGEIFSMNPTDLVHFKPLGLDAWRVFVEFAVNAEAFLWRSTDEFKVVGDAIGSPVAWSKENCSHMIQHQGKTMEDMCNSVADMSKPQGNSS